MLQLGSQLLRTDRGDLWQARDADGSGCLVRLLDYRLADADFRLALEGLRSDLATCRPPRVLPIAGHGRFGDYYHIQYQAFATVRGLSEYFSGQDWAERVRFAVEVLEMAPRWRESVPLPVGLHAGRIVAGKIAGRWLPHLAPCPPTRLQSPRWLSDVDSSVLGAIAPERLRHVLVTPTAEDVYAAGVLVLEALGSRATSGLSPGGRLEAQARSALITADLPDVQEPFRSLPRVPAVSQRVEALRRVLRRCTAFDPAARPQDLLELRNACVGVLALERPDEIATGLDVEGLTADALQLVDWALTKQPDLAGRRRLAASFCRRLNRPHDELRHLERLLADEPRDRDASRRRFHLRAVAYLKASDPVLVGSDSEGDWLLEESARLHLDTSRGVTIADQEDEQRQFAKELRVRVAAIHDRRGNRLASARELYEITQLAPTDVDAYLLAALSYRALAEEPGLSEDTRRERVEDLNAFISTGLNRLEQMRKAEVVDEERARECADLLQRLRQQ
jgi:hypothetical protein